MTAYYEKQFSSELDIPDAPQTQSTLIIASTPRSGSHMLGHALATTGALGVPFEYCNPHWLREWETKLSTRGAEATMAALMTRRTTPNGVFSIKMHYSQAACLGGVAQAVRSFPDPRIVYIHRGDFLRQAMSHMTATQTGVWITGRPKKGEARYDRAHFDRSLRTLAWEKGGWETYLRQTDLSVMRVRFEEFAADVEGHVRQILGFMGIDPESVPVPQQPETARQSSGRQTDEWIARYLAEGPLYERPARRRLRRLKRLVTSPLRRFRRPVAL